MKMIFQSAFTQRSTVAGNGCRSRGANGFTAFSADPTSR
jgi:hypothetical protein